MKFSKKIFLQKFVFDKATATAKKVDCEITVCYLNEYFLIEVL